MRNDFQVRRLQPELMDDPEIEASLHRQALSGLRRINWWSRPDTVFWNALAPLLVPQRHGERLSILDIASGGGDVAIRLAQRAREAGKNLEIVGCDMSQTAVEFATEQAAEAGLSNVRFQLCNVLTDPLTESAFDVVMCSLFLHHLNENDGIILLKRMKSAALRLVLVDDLRRSAAGYWLAWIGCRLLTRCPIVHVDGPISVEGALTVSEAVGMAEKAGLSGVRCRRHWPQRYLLSWAPQS
jgi:2-polyprenyl-3-methyl-5-hydroxy-6-metoxy-1,4-benzoquinol methylase